MPVSSAGYPAIVIDAGIGACTVLATRLSDETARAWEQWQLANAEIYAPGLWRYEVTSVIRKALKSRDITPEEAEGALETALRLDVQLVEADAEMCRSALGWAARLDQGAAYDSFYLSLAERLGAVFWTTDQRLANSVRQAGADWAHWIGEGEEVRQRSDDHAPTEGS